MQIDASFDRVEGLNLTSISSKKAIPENVNSILDLQGRTFDEDAQEFQSSGEDHHPAGHDDPSRVLKKPANGGR